MKIVLFRTIQFWISTQFNWEKTFLFQAIQFIQAVRMQLIQFSISTHFVYTQLNVKTVLSNNSVYCKYSFKKQFHFNNSI